MPLALTYNRDFSAKGFADEVGAEAVFERDHVRNEQQFNLSLAGSRVVPSADPDVDVDLGLSFTGKVLWLETSGPLIVKVGGQVITLAPPAGKKGLIVLENVSFAALVVRNEGSVSVLVTFQVFGD